MKYFGNYLNTRAASRANGVLLVNLGTPDEPTPQALRRYLAEFLADPRVVELPRWLWRLILHGIVLRVRPARSARAYRQVWMDNTAPLLHYSTALTDALKQHFSHQSDLTISLAMRYGKPSIADGIERLRSDGVQRIAVLPLYPQYSSATTGSVFDAVAAVLQAQRWVPDLRFISGYHTDPGYIRALAESVRGFWSAHGTAEHLLISFHGLPQASAAAGDPYPLACRETARLLADSLQLTDAQWELAYQSRFGRQQWLRPYFDDRLQRLPGEGKRRIDVICPGFAADCLETLEEVAIRGRETFVAAGGEQLRYLPALNAGPGHVHALAGILRSNVSGWLDQPPLIGLRIP